VIGYSKPNFRKSGETLYYDKKGNVVGKEVRSYKNPSKSTFYDDKGRETGSSYRSEYRGRTEYYDNKKNQLYSARPNYMKESRAVFYEPTKLQEKNLRDLNKEEKQPESGSLYQGTGPRSSSGCLTSVLLIISVITGIFLLK